MIFKKPLFTALTLVTLINMYTNKIAHAGSNKNTTTTHPTAPRDKNLFQFKNAIADERSSLKTQSIPLKYRSPADLITLIKRPGLNLLSKKGHIYADMTSQKLWLHDDREHTRKIMTLVATEDQPPKQILIRARIVSLDNNASRILGLLFHPHNQEGTFATLTKRFPSWPIASLNRSILLDTTLDALEQTGRAQILSKPELVVLNKKRAIIESGQAIPYPTSTTNGVTSMHFKKATLSLSVTPTIHSNHRLTLNIVITQDAVGDLNVRGMPGLRTQSLQTRVLLQDQQTLMLGGIIESHRHIKHTRIPLLNQVPLIGKLFEHRYIEIQRRELFIFITPKILI